MGDPVWLEDFYRYQLNLVSKIAAMRPASLAKRVDQNVRMAGCNQPEIVGFGINLVCKCQDVQGIVSLQNAKPERGCRADNYRFGHVESPRNDTMTSNKA